MALTDRQKEIKGLQKQGMNAPQIAEKLGITVNAVYQQKRRMKKAQGGGSPTAAKPTARNATAKSGRKSGNSGNAKGHVKLAPTPAVATPAVTVRDMTPLQAVRAKRESFTAALKEAEALRDDAAKALAKAEEQVTKVRERVSPELAALDAAEAALKGELSLPDAATPEPEKPKAQRSRSRTQGGKAGKDQAKPADATQTAPGAPESGNDGAAATPQPSGQTEREQTADFDPAAPASEAQAQDDAAEAPQEPVPA